MFPEKQYDPERFYLLKAEALCAALQANGIAFDDLVIRHAGAFRKSYRNDVEAVMTGTEDEKQVVISINRDGLYDKLPEGLFHQTKGGSNTTSLSNMVGEYRRYREEEKYARKFFQPLEQELFRYAVLNELEERKIRFGLMNGKLDTAFFRFWNISTDLPAAPAALLVLIMPWLKEIRGNMLLTAKALSIMLGREVNAVLSIEEDQGDERAGYCLGTAALLGIDTICGDHFPEPCAVWTFTILGIEPDEMEAYTPANDYGRFLRRFEELFIPLDTELRFEYHCIPIAETMMEEPVLGYGFYL